MKKIEMKTQMSDALREGIATVTFTKKDGTKRVMEATLMTEFMPIIKPSDPTETPKNKRKVNEEVLAVFDIEKDSFRSFRIDSVVSFFTSRVALPDVQGLIDG